MLPGSKDPAGGKKGVKTIGVSATCGSNGPVCTVKSAVSLHVTGSKKPCVCFKGV